MFRLFEHTADLGLHAEAPTLEQLYAEAARGFLSVLVADPATVAERETRVIRVSGTAPDLLLFDLLSELLFLFESERFLTAGCEVRRDETGLTATLRGEPMQRERHPMEHEIKAITYHELACYHDRGQWNCDVIFDI